MIYGTITLPIPGEIFHSLSTPTQSAQPSLEYVAKLKTIFKNFTYTEIYWHSNQEKIFTHPELNKSTHVFLRDDFVPSPLAPPYTGLHKVIVREEKRFSIEINEVNRDHLKPAEKTTILKQ